MRNFLRRSSIYIIAVVIVVGFLLLQFFLANKSDQKDNSNLGLWENYVVETMYLGGNSYRFVVADTPDHTQKGLMFVRKPTEGFDGMVFRFSDKQSRTFWNKNTFEDLKLYWMADGEIIGTSDFPSVEKSKSIVIVSSPAPADTVVEIIK